MMNEAKKTVAEKKALLEGFRMTEMRIRELEEEQNTLWSRALNRGVYDSMPSAKSKKDKTARAVERLERISEIIDTERDDLALIQFNIMQAVRKLSSVTERRIIHLKYIGEPDGIYHRPLTLYEIAEELGYGIDRIKQLHKKALQELKL